MDASMQSELSFENSYAFIECLENERASRKSTIMRADPFSLRQKNNLFKYYIYIIYRDSEISIM